LYLSLAVAPLALPRDDGAREGMTPSAPPVPPCAEPAARRSRARDAPQDFKEKSMRAKRLTSQQRQEIFHALVTTQDLGIMTVPQSVQHVAKQFDVTEAQVKQIEEEGIDKEWPPLNEAAVQPAVE
jgi:hypothetical protein